MAKKKSIKKEVDQQIIVSAIDVRLKLNEDYVLQLAERYEAGFQGYPPIVVYEISQGEGKGLYAVVDGRHRLAAQRFIDRKMIPCEVIQEPPRDELIRMAYAANVGGALPPTRKDQEFVIEDMIVREKFTKKRVLEVLEGFMEPATILSLIERARRKVRNRKINSAILLVTEGGRTQSQASKEVGISEATLKRYLNKTPTGIRPIQLIREQQRQTFKRIKADISKEHQRVRDAIVAKTMTESNANTLLADLGRYLGHIQANHSDWERRIRTALAQPGMPIEREPDRIKKRASGMQAEAAIIDILRQSKKKMTVEDIQYRVPYTNSTVRSTLAKLARDGVVVVAGTVPRSAGSRWGRGKNLYQWAA